MTTEIANRSTAQHDGIRRLIRLAADRHRGDSYAGRRQETRFRYPLELEATLDPSDKQATLVAKLHDICPAGIAVWVHREFEVGTVIYIREFGTDDAGEWLQATVSRVGRGILGMLTAATFDSPPPAEPSPVEPRVEQAVEEVSSQDDESFEEGCEIEPEPDGEENPRRSFWAWLGLSE